MTTRNSIATFFIIASLLLLYPGLTQPILNIYVGAKLPIVGELALYDQTQSIAQSIESLFKSGNTLVAVLILLFSVVVPVTKMIALLIVLFAKTFRFRRQLYGFIALIGKWSMADVFVVSIFMAYLSGQANSNINATLFDGFYYFTAYCIASIIGTQLIDLKGVFRNTAIDP